MACAFAKKAFRHSVHENIKNFSEQLDQALPKLFSGEDCIWAQEKRFMKLKMKKQ